jgi:hypothetical protein
MPRRLFAEAFYGIAAGAEINDAGTSLETTYNATARLRGLFDRILTLPPRPASQLWSMVRSAQIASNRVGANPKTTIARNGPYLYRGWHALLSKREELRTRKSGDPFIGRPR